MCDPLAIYLETVGVAAVDVTAILAGCQNRLTKRNEVILAQGQVCRHVYFVNQGCLRAFYPQPDGQESTRYVAFENQFGTALRSFILQQPSAEVLQTVEGSNLCQLPYAHFQHLLATVPVWERIYRQQLESAYLINTWRLESFITMAATQRYDYLLQTNPQLVHRLSNRLVASYLGITQESLSRLKAKRL